MGGSIVVVGSLNADLWVRLDRHPLPGETVRGETAITLPGGKGANQAVAAANLGARVAMVGAVGRDAHADVALSLLRASGVDLTHVREVDGPTGLAIVSVDRAGENSIVVVGGANERVDAAFVESAAVAIAAAGIVVLQGEIPASGTAEAVELATGRIILNLAPVVPLPPEILRSANPLVVNEHEGALALGLLRGANTAPSGSDMADHAAIVLGLLAEGVPTVVMTLGAAGALVGEGPAAPLVHLPAPHVHVVDSTGAGDAFVGALAQRLADGESLVAASRFAARVGAFACTRRGAQPSYPTADDVLPDV
ncbi:MAG: ribokinase [Micropruina sp.]|nr:ribokinase [Micropruina sp.]HBX81694.1 ribokinase [Propionibacteriaceae bacterium]